MRGQPDILVLGGDGMLGHKIYGLNHITMPPDMARQAERLAKKENRTMSELMREALRRYQHPQVLFDPTG